MEQIEPITEFLKRRLREAGAARFDAIADESGVTGSFIRKFVYGSRENPRIQTIQPLLDFFAAVDRGERRLPEIGSEAGPRTPTNHPHQRAGDLRGVEPKAA